MSESTAPDWRKDAEELNEALHRALGAIPCRTACTHFLTDRWSLLGIANVAARAATPATPDPEGAQQ